MCEASLRLSCAIPYVCWRRCGAVAMLKIAEPSGPWIETRGRQMVVEPQWVGAWSGGVQGRASGEFHIGPTLRCNLWNASLSSEAHHTLPQGAEPCTLRRQPFLPATGHGHSQAWVCLAGPHVGAPTRWLESADFVSTCFLATLWRSGYASGWLALGPWIETGWRTSGGCAPVGGHLDWRGPGLVRKPHGAWNA